MTQIVRRSTKYTNDVMAILKSKHHATNAEIAQELRNVHPEVSDTTVHRITQRLCGDGMIGLAPPTKKGCLRYDIRKDDHDHFVCSDCDGLMDIKIGAIAFAVYAAQNNLVSVASVYLIITYTGSVAHELWNMNGIMRNYNRIIGNANDMVEILQTPTTLIDKSDSKLKVTNGKISMNKITFTHDEGQGDTLFHDFSLDIKPGEKIGLVGASGSGKTTLTKLLLRFADIDSGKITIDGQDISEVTQASLRAKIAYVPQEPLLFHRSVRENTAFFIDELVV
jgi:ABC-type glutathione transport system ATPase component